MAALTPSQLQSLAYNAGFRGSDLKTAVAVALAESGGNPLAYNPETAAHTPAGSGSRGLWQIYGAAHPIYNSTAVFNPQANANAAYSVYKAAGNRFTPWSTFNNGSASRIAQGLSLGATATGGASGGASIAALLGGALNPRPTAPAVLPAITAGGPGSLEDWVFLIGGYGLFFLGLILLFVASKKQ